MPFKLLPQCEMLIIILSFNGIVRLKKIIFVKLDILVLRMNIRSLLRLPRKKFINSGPIILDTSHLTSLSFPLIICEMGVSHRIVVGAR